MNAHNDGGFVETTERLLSRKTLTHTLGILAILFSLGATAPALAVHNEFELEGDIADDAASANRPDWGSIFDSAGHEVALPPNFLGTQFTRDFVPGGTSDTSTFDSAKDTLDIGSWKCAESNNVGDKSDLLNTYASFYKTSNTNETHLYFGAERFSNSGSGAVGVWFLQDPSVGCTAPAKIGSASFSGHHVDGDLLLLAGFTTGGQVTSIDVYRWTGGADGSLDSTPMLSGVDCKTPAGNDSVCATSNTGPVTTPWPAEDKDGDNVLDVSEFVEGGFNLTRLGLDLGCFNKMLITTRGSTSASAPLIDYALGAFVTCNDSNACTTDSCDPAVGCVATPISCNDFNACTDDGCDPATGCFNTDNSAGCDDHNPCTDDTCDPEVGCLNTPRTGACDDGDACTDNDTCSAGVCVGGGAVTCNDGNPCTEDSCNPSTGCVTANNTASCDDGNACTQVDTCGGGTCNGSDPVVCTASDQCHVAGTCDPSSGRCSNPAKNDDTPCDDSNACTQVDTCQSGTCSGSNPVVCAASDQCHMVGSCDPATGACSNPEKPSGSSCDDGNACTGSDGSDSCQAGACVGTAVENGTGCDDGNACTQTDTCVAGSCSGGNPVTCTPADACHDAGTCDPTSGACSNPTKPDGIACNDRNDCTESDTCQNGTCAGGPVEEGTPCDDTNGCTLADACHIGTCVGTAATDGATCDDGDTCTQTDSCQSGTCVGTNPLADGTPCSDDNACTQTDVCDSGACVGVPLEDGTPCDDGNVCSANDSCQAGLCEGTVLPNGTTCDDTNECTVTDVCYSGTCLGNAAQDGLTCDDSDACTQIDTCGNGSCRGSDPIVCAALDDCHDAGVCNPANGTCSDPVKHDGVTCDDNDACTQTDACSSGFCTGNNPVICTASDQCHVAGTCDPANGACSNPAKQDGATCNDNNACTQTDTCSSGTCTGGNPVVCSASDQCHSAGTCDPVTGNCSNPNQADGTPCNDNSNCTAGDMCVSGLCLGDLPGCGDGLMDPTCGEQCDDGNTQDRDGCTASCAVEAPTVCGSVPATGCRQLAAAKKGSLQLRGFVPKKSKKALAWQYSRGAVTLKADFGNPLVDTAYEICVYDQQHGTSALVMSAGIPAGGMCGRKPCWKGSRSGFTYRNRAVGDEGLYSLTLREGKKAGRTRITLRGKNEKLPVPPLPLMQDSTITVQLKNSDGVCWETRHSSPAAKNTAVKRPKFQDKAD